MLFYNSIPAFLLADMNPDRLIKMIQVAVTNILYKLLTG